MRAFFGLLVSFVATCNFVYADYVLRWSPTSGTSTGAAIGVDLFLDETSPGTNLANFGVLGTSYSVTLQGVGTLDVPIENPAFDDPIAPTSNGMVATVEQLNPDGVKGPGTVKIGTFSILPTSIGTGNLTINGLQTLSDFVVYENVGDAVILDSILLPAQTFEYSFTAVPEPSSVGTIASLACLKIWHRKRRRKPGDADRWKRWRQIYRWRKANAGPFVATKNWG